MTTPDPFQPFPSQNEIVELIGGPLDGDKVTWNARMKTGEAQWTNGIAVYHWEGPGKAVFSYDKPYFK